jgi:hypothetical protein
MEVSHVYLHNFKEYIQKCKNAKRNVHGLVIIQEGTELLL